MNKKIKFLNLKQINLFFEEELLDAFKEVLHSGWLVLGDNVKKFEENYAKFNETKYCIGVSNGLDALILSLKSLDIKNGDEVIVPSNTYIATWLAVSIVGATPVPVEPDIETYNINPSLIEEKISNKTKAIIPVNLYGQAAKLEEICKIAEKHGIKVIEDNAQAQGAMYKGKKTGSWGHVNATSFYPGKNLGALGDAGSITTNEIKLQEKLVKLRNYGSTKKYYHDIIGHNCRLDELQAAFLNIKLKRLEFFNNKRIQIANVYYDFLKNTGDIILPKIDENATSVYHQFIIRTKLRDQLLNYLSNHGIETMIHYPVPSHLQKAYKRNYKKGDFPIAEEISNTCLSLPISLL